MKRDALFVPARPRDKHILDVFPQFPVLLQVDLNGDLAAFLIRYKLDSGHGFIVLQLRVPAYSYGQVAPKRQQPAASPIVWPGGAGHNHTSEMEKVESVIESRLALKPLVKADFES